MLIYESCIPSFSPPTFSKWSRERKKYQMGLALSVESKKPSSVPSAKILHTLTLTVDKEDYFHYVEQILPGSEERNISTLCENQESEMIHRRIQRLTKSSVLFTSSRMFQE